MCIKTNKSLLFKHFDNKILTILEKRIIRYKLICFTQTHIYLGD